MMNLEKRSRWRLFSYAYEVIYVYVKNNNEFTAEDDNGHLCCRGVGALIIRNWDISRICLADQSGHESACWSCSSIIRTYVCMCNLNSSQIGADTVRGIHSGIRRVWILIWQRVPLMVDIVAVGGVLGQGSVSEVTQKSPVFKQKFHPWTWIELPRNPVSWF